MDLKENKKYTFQRAEINRIIADYLKCEIGVKIDDATTSFHWTGDKVDVTVSNTTKHMGDLS